MKLKETFSEEQRRYVSDRDLIVLFLIIVVSSVALGIIIGYDMKDPDIRFIDGRSLDDFILDLTRKADIYCKGAGYEFGALESSGSEITVRCYLCRVNVCNIANSFSYKELLE